MVLLAVRSLLARMFLPVAIAGVIRRQQLGLHVSTFHLELGRTPESHNLHVSVRSYSNDLQIKRSDEK